MMSLYKDIYRIYCVLDAVLNALHVLTHQSTKYLPIWQGSKLRHRVV